MTEKEIIYSLASKYGLKVNLNPAQFNNEKWIFSFHSPKHIPDPTPERIEMIKNIIFIFFRSLPNFSTDLTEHFDGHWVEIDNKNLYKLLILIDETMKEK